MESLAAEYKPLARRTDRPGTASSVPGVLQVIGRFYFAPASWAFHQLQNSSRAAHRLTLGW